MKFLCEKLYFTEFLYQQRRKVRDRKDNFNMAPPQSCIVTVSVFVGISPSRRGNLKQLRESAKQLETPARKRSTANTEMENSWASRLQPVCLNVMDKKLGRTQRFPVSSLPGGHLSFNIQTAERPPSRVLLNCKAGHALITGKLG